MNCASPYSTYVCTNGTGTTCIKASVQIPLISAATTCSTTDLVLMSGSEYTTLKNQTSTPPAPQSVVITVQPYKATSDDYAAISLIFGAVLLASVLIWGSRRILELFRKPSEH